MTDGHGRSSDERPLPPAGDPAALGELWRQHRRWLGSVLAAHGVRPGELEDLLQEVAVTVVEKIGTLREAGALRPWLRAIAINTARRVGRGEGRRREHRAPHAQLDARPDPAAQRELQRASDRSEVARTLAWVRELPIEQREPLLMKSLGAMSQREIAATLGLPETTVETRLARARRALRARAGRPDGALAPIGEPSEDTNPTWKTP